MQRIINILLFSLLYCFCGIINYADKLAMESLQPSELHQIVSESENPDDDADQMYDNQMLRTPTPRGALAEEVSSVTITSSSSARYRTSRTSFTQKIMAIAISNRRAGHVTNIFEYNHFTSSLCIEYYLYALCRLRI